MACKKIQITVGDTFKGVLQLRKSVNGVVNPYPIITGSIIDIHFPAYDSAAPVVLSTINTGEVVITDANLSTISFLGSPEKSALLNPGKLQKIDIIVTEPGGNIFTLTSENILEISQRAND